MSVFRQHVANRRTFLVIHAHRMKQLALRNLVAARVERPAGPTFPVLGNKTPEAYDGAQTGVAEGLQHFLNARVGDGVAIKLKPFHATSL
jgi:hypothetical protein